MILKILEEVDFPVNKLFLFASKKSKGKEIIYQNNIYHIIELSLEFIDNIDIAFFAAGSDVSKKWCPIFLEKGIVVIDNSSYFRMDKNASLIIPEVNFSDIDITKIICNPNCSTIQSVLVLSPLVKFGIKRIIYTTYQAVSGSGYKGINDLANNTSFYYPYKIKETCIPQIDSFLLNGYTKEEMKMIDETKKILSLENVWINSTCIRVPVNNSHGVSIVVDLEEDIDINALKTAFSEQDGLVLLDDIKEGIYPTSLSSNGNNYVYVGRIRKDIYSSKTYMFYCVADNIRRGAAFNAVMIAKKIIEKGIATKNQL